MTRRSKPTLSFLPSRCCSMPGEALLHILSPDLGMSFPSSSNNTDNQKERKRGAEVTENKTQQGPGHFPSQLARSGAGSVQAHVGDGVNIENKRITESQDVGAGRDLRDHLVQPLIWQMKKLRPRQRKWPGSHDQSVAEPGLEGKRPCKYQQWDVATEFSDPKAPSKAKF